MNRPQIMGHRGKWPRRLLRLWQRYEAVALEVTYFHSDDHGESSFEIGLPSWPWRWVCWIEGHADSTYGECCVCRKALK
jgi:hypothetical protein